MTTKTLDWRDFKFPVQYIETDNLSFARRTFGILNGTGRKRQSAFMDLRTSVLIVRLDADTSDARDVDAERKVSIAEKHDCFPVENLSSLMQYPGTFANIATFKTLSDQELEIACAWHNQYFHYVPLHVSCFFMFRDMLRTYNSAKLTLSDKLKQELAGLIQGAFGDLQQFKHSVSEAFGQWHNKRYGYSGVWNDEAYAVALLQLYQHLGGTEQIPFSLIDRFDDLVKFFDLSILNMQTVPAYQAVVRKPNPMRNINPLQNGLGRVVGLQDRVDKLAKSHAWLKAIKELERKNFVFDMSRLPKVEMMELGDILLDEDIQRALDEKHCANIIDYNKFDPAILQTLQCIKTTQGQLISIDGQHTASVIAGLIAAGFIK